MSRRHNSSWPVQKLIHLALILYSKSSEEFVSDIYLVLEKAWLALLSLWSGKGRRVCLSEYGKGL